MSAAGSSSAGAAPMQRALTGSVVRFDREVGLGEVEATDGTVYPFHCIVIADGTRSIEVCATPTTAPATSAAPTTVASTTEPVATTAPATTVPATTATTAATVASAVVSAPSTTAVVAQAGPTSVVATPTTAVQSLGQLPVTGGDAPWRGVATALIALGFGVLFVAAARRPDAA